MYVSIGQASEIIGVSISTLRRWETEERYLPDFRTKGGHRRYCLKRINEELLDLSEDDVTEPRKVYCYARVSSHDQRLDLERQKKRLSKYCKSKKYDYEIISDLGSGVNYKKKGLIKLINLICSKKISKLVLTYKDRLLRFGSPLLFKLCEFFNTEIIVINSQAEKTFEQELVADVLEIMTVFTAKVHGKRSHANRLACNG